MGSRLGIFSQSNFLLVSLLLLANATEALAVPRVGSRTRPAHAPRRATAATPAQEINPVGPLSAADLHTIDEEESTGIRFRDNDPRLALPFVVTTHVTDQPPGICSTSTGPGVSNVDPWTEGFRQALSGQRFYGGAQVNFPLEDPRSPANPARRACAQIPNDGTQVSIKNRSCCMTGYLRGSQVLASQIEQLIATGATPSDPSINVCLENFQAGKSAAATYCARQRNVDQCGYSRRGYRYLACFSLGYFINRANCEPEGQGVARGLLRILAPSLTDRRITGFNDEGRPAEAPNASSAVGARDFAAPRTEPETP